MGARVAELRRARGFTQDAFAGRLGVAVKYYQRIEGGRQNLTLKTLDRLAAALDLSVGELLEPPRPRQVRPGRPPATVETPTSVPFRVVTGERRPPAGAVPLVTIEVAAGVSGQFTVGEVAAWVLPRTRRRIGSGMFVARVTGDSMEPLIGDGSYCLFAVPAACRGRGEITLVESRALEDPDTGGHYAIKRVYFERERGRDVVRLASENPAYAPIVVERAADPALRLVASFVETLA